MPYGALSCFHTTGVYHHIHGPFGGVILNQELASSLFGSSGIRRGLRSIRPPIRYEVTFASLVLLNALTYCILACRALRLPCCNRIGCAGSVQVGIITAGTGPESAERLKNKICAAGSTSNGFRHRLLDLGGRLFQSWLDITDYGTAGDE